MRFRKCFNRVGFVLACCGAFTAAQVTPAAAAVNITLGNDPFTFPIFSYRDIPFRTVIRQQYDFSCGSAALATLLKFHYGKNTNEAEIFQAMYLAGDQEKIQKVGFSLLDMKQYLDRNGFPSDGYRMTLDDVLKTGVPAITVIAIGAYRHFVVIKGVQNDMVLVGDPALGLKTYPKADFEKIWNGIVFMIHKDAVPDPKFNVVAEWTPWARAPVGSPLDSHSLFGVNVTLPVVYQVLQSSSFSGAGQ
jgi:uncharacterized protein